MYTIVFGIKAKKKKKTVKDAQAKKEKRQDDRIWIQKKETQLSYIKSIAG